MADIKYGSPYQQPEPPQPPKMPQPQTQNTPPQPAPTAANSPAAVIPKKDPSSAVKERKYPCKGCGSDLVYEPGKDALKCPNCGFTEKIPQTAEEIKEYSFSEYLAKPKSTGFGAPPGQRRNARCQGCGATMELDATVRAMKCAYCGAPMITEDDKTAEQDIITPEALIPFKVNLSQAQQAFRTWLSGLWFAPSGLAGETSMKQFQGIYRPYWTYDSNTNSSWSGSRGDYYYTTETYTTEENGQQVQRERQVRHTAWTPVSGTYSDFFDDVLVRAAKNPDRSGDFNLKEMRHYSPEYLSGFNAERYAISVQDGWTSAKKVIDDSIYNSVLQQIGGDEQRVNGIQTAYNAIMYKHILLPIWTNAYIYNGTSYFFEVNGQTGKVNGTRPYSWLKIGCLVVSILFFIAIFILLAVVFGSRGHR